MFKSVGYRKCSIKSDEKQQKLQDKQETQSGYIYVIYAIKVKIKLLYTLQI